MRTDRFRTITLLAAFFVMLSAAYAVAQEYKELTFIKEHPVEVKQMPICSQCHPDKWAEQDHVANWDILHKLSAARSVRVCNICHLESYCADCHANKEEIKPSDKFKDEPTRSLPHRGDYITQHMIDAKINPAPCFRCHGRQNNERCRRCHK